LVVTFHFCSQYHGFCDILSNSSKSQGMSCASGLHASIASFYHEDHEGHEEIQKTREKS